MTRPEPRRPRGMDSRIRTMLQVRNLTVVAAAKTCSLPQSTLEDYLAGKSLPGSAALLALSQGLGCSADWLLGGGQEA